MTSLQVGRQPAKAHVEDILTQSMGTNSRRELGRKSTTTTNQRETHIRKDSISPEVVFKKGTLTWRAGSSEGLSLVLAIRRMMSYNERDILDITKYQAIALIGTIRNYNGSYYISPPSSPGQ